MPRNVNVLQSVIIIKTNARSVWCLEMQCGSAYVGYSHCAHTNSPTPKGLIYIPQYAVVSNGMHRAKANKVCPHKSHLATYLGILCIYICVCVCMSTTSFKVWSDSIWIPQKLAVCVWWSKHLYGIQSRSRHLQLILASQVKYVVWDYRLV